MIKKSIIFFIYTALTISVSAETYNNVYELPSLSVVEESATAKATAHNLSVSSMLDDTPGIIINSQGSVFAQTDLSVQGGSFSSAGLSIGGISLTNPQTEHFNAEIPFSSSFFSSLQILTGVDQAKNSSGHLLGSIDLKLKDLEDKKLFSSEFFSENGSIYSFSYENNKSDLLNFSFAVEKADLNELDKSDNDLERENISLRFNIPLNKFTLDILGGRLDKTFGASGFYGVSKSLAANETIDDKSILTILSKNKDEDNFLNYYTISALYKETDDEYNLALPSSLYSNSHKSVVQTLALKGATNTFPLTGQPLYFQMALEKEDIDSNSLGDYDRERINFSLIPVIIQNDIFSLETGLNMLKREDESLKVMGLLSWVWYINDRNSFSFSMTETTRDPSYTELNYESVGSLGNSDLDFQDNVNLETGLKTILSPDLKLEIKTFYQRSRDAVDWLMNAQGDRWTAANLQKVEVSGLEAIISYYKPNFQCDIWLSLLDKESKEDFFASRYCFDYAESFTALALAYQPIDFIDLSLKLSYRQQTENPTRSGKDDFLNLRFTSLFKINEFCSISFKGTNLLDKEFEMLPGLPVTERKLSAAFEVKW